MKIAFKYFLVIIVVFYQSFAIAQNPFGYFKMDHWDTKKGMPNDFVLNVYQTSDGFIWLTGYSGLTRFDGVNFTNFNSSTEPLFKSDGIISLFVELGDSTLWIPSVSNGLLAYKNGKFNAYLKEYPSLFYNGLTKNNELLLFSRNVRDSIIVFNPVTKKYYTKLYTEFANLLYQRSSFMGLNAKTGTVEWKEVFNKLIHIINGKEFVLTEKEGYAKDLNINSLTTDSKGRLWVGSNKGLLTWNGSSLIPFHGMDKLTLIAGNPTFGLVTEDHEKGIWAATNKGLFYLPDGANEFIPYPQFESMKLQTISHVFCDKEGNIWVGTDRGLFKITKSKIINYSEKDGIDNNKVNAVCQIKDDEYIVGSRSNLYLLKNGSISPYPLKNKGIISGINNIVFLYKDSKNNIWVCSDKEIYEITPDGEKEFPVESKTTGSNVRMAYEGKDGRVYFGIAYRGIGFINDKGVFEYLSFPKADLSSYYISSIRQLSDGTWVVTSYNRGILFIYPDGHIKRIENIENIKGVGVFCSYLDPNNILWFAGNNGIIKYQNDSIQVLGLKDGMPEVSIFEVLADHQGYFWLPSNKGIIRAKKSEILARMADKKSIVNWMMYDEGDGMLNRQCVGARHSIVSSDGKIMVVGIGGLVVVDPSHLNKNMMAPSMNIHRMDLDDSMMDLTKPIIVSAGDHRYILGYSALSFKAPEKVKIKFRLVGYDKDWILSAGDRRAFYTNLPSGTYTFQVIAANNDGVWNENPVSLVFEVKPFFYETIWFKILVFGLLISFVWLFIQWRTRAARDRSVLLEKQVSLRTEELSRSNQEVISQKQEIEKALEKLKSTQSQLIQSEKMASLGELTAGIAHEIQNPLNFVNNFSEVNTELLTEMKEELNRGNIDEAKSIADDIIGNEQKINHHGKRADAIVKGMLQHSRSSSGQKEPTDINALTDEYLRLAYHGLRAKDKSFNATMHTDFEESIGKIPIIPQDIGRVILNLITNAFYVVDEKKKSENENYHPTVSVSTKKTDGKILISVTDNGNGIPSKVLDKIFQPFFTTKPTGKGTGLGLSLSYDIVKAHGGELKVETKEREGTEFTIVLNAN